MIEFPATELDIASRWRSFMGSYYQHVMSNPELLEAVLTVYRTLYRNLEEPQAQILAALDRRKAADYLEIPLGVLTLQEADCNSQSVSPQVYDGTLNYGGGSVYGAVRPVDRYGFPAPGGWCSCGLLCDRLIRPTVVWVEGLDYVLSNGILWFRRNPFLETRFTISDSRQLRMFAHQVRVEESPCRALYGSALEGTATLTNAQLNAVWDALSLGPSPQRLRHLLGASLGLPAIAADETVQAIVESDQLVVITDQRAYRYPAAAQCAVAVGDLLHAGDFPIELLEVYSGAALGAADLPYLRLDASLGVPDFGGELRVLAGEHDILVAPGDVRCLAVTGPADAVNRYWTWVNTQEPLTFEARLLREFGQLPARVDLLKMLQRILGACGYELWQLRPPAGVSLEEGATLWLYRIFSGCQNRILQMESDLPQETAVVSEDSSALSRDTVNSLPQETIAASQYLDRGIEG